MAKQYYLSKRINKFFDSFSKFVLSRERYFFILTLLILLATTLYFIITTTSFVRYYADDFCLATTLKKYGYWGTQKFWWLSWSGRYSYNLLIHFFELFGRGVVRIVPILVAIALTVSILPLVNKALVLKSKRIALLFAYFFVAVLLINAPNIVQSFYWQSGVTNYIIPIIFLNIFFSLVVFLITRSKKIGRAHLILSALLVFIAGGFSESFAVAQTLLLAMILLAILIIKFSNSKKATAILLAGLVGSAISVAVMYFAPGTSARATTITQASSVSYVIKSTILGTKWYLQRMLTIKSLLYSFFISFVIIFFLVKNKFKKTKDLSIKQLSLIIVIALLNIIFSSASVFALAYYSMSYLPPERALIVVLYMVYASFLVISFCVSVGIIKLFSKASVNKIRVLFLLSYLGVFILLLGQVVSHWSAIRIQVENYAISWDIEEEKILANEKGDDIVIKYIRPPGDLDGFLENKGWVASCASAYYGKKILVINE